MPLPSPWDCVDCPQIVKIGGPYFEAPCGTRCLECMKQHVKTCVACAKKFPDAVTPRFGCPACKSELILENNIVQVRLRVSEWDEEGEPVDFRYPFREVDDTIRTVNENEAARYYCESCGEEFEIPERLQQEKVSDAPSAQTIAGHGSASHA